MKGWSSGLTHCDINRESPGSNSTKPGLGTEPRYEAPSDLRF